MISRGIALVLLSLLITIGAVSVTLTRPAPDRRGQPLTEVQMTHDVATDLDPVFSPDGRRIAFSSNRSGSFDIWVMDADGRRRMQFTSMDSDERSPKWSPDGKMIAFLTIAGATTDIWVSSIDGEEIINLARDGGSKKSLEWNPSGEWLVYDSNGGGRWSIWLADLRVHRVVQLTEGQADNMYPSWTPDGRDILFSSNRSGVFKIYAMSSDGVGLRQLTSGAGNDIKPRMSPDGRYIAFVSDRRGRETLWIMNADATRMREARSDPPIQRPGDIGWAPELVSDSYPLWNSKSEGVMYFAKGAKYFRREGGDLVPVSGPGTHAFTFYQNIPVVAYLAWDPFYTTGSPGDPHYNTYWEQEGDSVVAMASLRDDEVFPSWRPDGKAIVYASNHDGTFDIWVKLLGGETPSPYG